MLQQLRHYPHVGLARARQFSVHIVRKIGPQGSGYSIDYGNPGPGVECADALDLTVWRHDSDVADSAQILETSPFRLRGEEHRVGDRNERRALSARRDIAHAKVADNVDAGSLGDDGRFSGLPGGMPRVMPNRLAVRCDRRDVVARDAGLGHHLYRRIGQPTSKIEIEPTILGGGATAERGRKSGALSARIRARCVGEKIDIDPSVARVPKARHRGADSIERSARHQADDYAGSHAMIR